MEYLEPVRFFTSPDLLSGPTSSTVPGIFPCGIRTDGRLAALDVSALDSRQ